MDVTEWHWEYITLFSISPAPFCATDDVCLPRGVWGQCAGVLRWYVEGDERRRQWDPRWGNGSGCHWGGNCTVLWCLSHPDLGWVDVFTLFPPRPPPPQRLLPLTSELLEINLRYLRQRIYRSGKMYGITFPWPWPKVTTVASISKNLLVCTIKWEPLIQTLQNVEVLLP